MMIERFAQPVELTPISRTANGAKTYLETCDPRLDFFFLVLEDTEKRTTIELLKKSWDHSALDTLRLIAYLRDIRSGKSIRYQYYVCLYWIYEHHPRTLLQNLPILIECGYWKDLLQLLMIILFRGKVANYLFNEEHSSSIQKKEAISAKRKIEFALEKEELENALKKRKPFAHSKLAKQQKKQFNGIKCKFYKQTRSEINDYIVDHYKVSANLELLIDSIFVSSNTLVIPNRILRSLSLSLPLSNRWMLTRNINQ